MSDPRLRRLGPVKAPTRAVAADILAYLDKRGTPLPNHPDTGDPVIWGHSTDPGNTEHYSGLALDLMVSGRPGIGDTIAAYVWHNRARFGLVHIIWQQRIRSVRVSPGLWRGMPDRGSPTNNHMDHPHVLISGRAISPGKGNPAPGQGGAISGPPKFPLPHGWFFGPKSGPASSVSGYYSHRDDLAKWQQRMRRRGWTIATDGLYGGQTRSIAMSFQREKGMSADGLIGAKTWRAAWEAKIT